MILITLKCVFLYNHFTKMAGNLMTYEIMNMYFKSYKNKQNHLSFALGQTERTESAHFLDVKLG